MRSFDVNIKLNLGNVKLDKLLQDANISDSANVSPKYKKINTNLQVKGADIRNISKTNQIETMDLSNSVSLERKASQRGDFYSQSNMKNDPISSSEKVESQWTTTSASQKISTPSSMGQKIGNTNSLNQNTPSHIKMDTPITQGTSNGKTSNLNNISSHSINQKTSSSPTQATMQNQNQTSHVEGKEINTNNLNMQAQQSEPSQPTHLNEMKQTVSTSMNNNINATLTETMNLHNHDKNSRPLLNSQVSGNFLNYMCQTYKVDSNTLNQLIHNHLAEYRQKGNYIDDKLAIARMCSNYYYGTNANLSVSNSNQRVHEPNQYSPRQIEQIMAASTQAYFNDIEAPITMIAISRTESGNMHNSSAAINCNNIAGVMSNRKIDTFDTLAQGCDNATRILGKTVNDLMRNGNYNNNSPLALNVQPTYNTEDANWYSVTLKKMAEVCKDYGIDWDSIFKARYGISNPLGN